MPRLFWKLFFSLWLSIMGFAVLMAWVNNVLVQQGLPDTPDAMFSRAAQRVDDMLSHALEQGGPESARRVLQGMPRHMQNLVFVFDENGRELLGRDHALRILHDPHLQHTRKKLVDAQGRFYQLVVLRGPPPAYFLEPGRRGLLLRLLLAALVSAGVSYFLARSLARPLESLGSASQRLAAGDLSTRVGSPLVERRDEFGALARDLDEMAGNLDRLQRANQRLLRDVSHELRSPLARLRVALELARRREQGAVTGELDRIELEATRLEALVDEVLDLLRETSAAAPLNLESVDLAELLADLVGVVEYEVPAEAPGIHLECEESLTLWADRELLWRAVENLLRNAVAYSGKMGGVTVRASAPDADTVEIHVVDHGPGIPEQHLGRIFDPFYRVQEARDRDSGGYGLGLAIAASAVRRHQGRIEAHNRPEGGLEIVIRMPRERVTRDA